MSSLSWGESGFAWDTLLLESLDFTTSLAAVEAKKRRAYTDGVDVSNASGVMLDLMPKVYKIR